MLGFLIRDELRLRLFVALGMVCDVAFFALRPDPALQSVMTGVVLVAINLAVIVVIILERTPYRLAPVKKRLYRDAFARLTPGQFRRISRTATWHETTDETVLVEEGEALRHLYYIQARSFTIRKAGVDYAAQGPAFVGDIALLTGQPSAAAVVLPEGAQYVAFPFTQLRRHMARSDALNNAITSLFAEDLAMKSAASAPLAQAPATSTRDRPTHVIDSPRLN